MLYEPDTTRFIYLNYRKISESQGGGNVRVLSQIDLDGDGMNEHYVTEATAQAMADVDEDLVAVRESSTAQLFPSRNFFYSRPYTLML